MTEWELREDTFPWIQTLNFDSSSADWDVGVVGGVGKPKAGSPGRASNACVYGTKALLAWLGITVKRGKTYTSRHQNKIQDMEECHTVEVGIAVDDYQSPIRRESRAQYLSTSPSGISSSEHHDSLSSRSSGTDYSHVIYTIHKVRG